MQRIPQGSRRVESVPKRFLLGLAPLFLLAGMFGFVSIEKRVSGSPALSDIWPLLLCLTLMAAPLLLVRRKWALVLAALMMLAWGYLVIGVFRFFEH
jgi:hypothetical protein